MVKHFEPIITNISDIWAKTLISLVSDSSQKCPLDGSKDKGERQLRNKLYITVLHFKQQLPIALIKHEDLFVFHICKKKSYVRK